MLGHIQLDVGYDLLSREMEGNGCTFIVATHGAAKIMALR